MDPLDPAERARREATIAEMHALAARHEARLRAFRRGLLWKLPASIAVGALLGLAIGRIPALFPFVLWLVYERYQRIVSNDD